MAADEVVFRLADPSHELARASLAQDLRRPGTGPPLVYDVTQGAWTVAFPRPDADRMEYQFVVERPDGTTAWLCDPANPERVSGPLGERSVLRFEGYREPGWVGSAALASGRRTEAAIPSRVLRATLPVRLWQAPGTAPDEPLPLLVAHDGPEYADHADLLRLLDAASAAGRVPPLRAALIGPVARDEIYSASAAYTRAMREEVVPRLAALAPRAPGPPRLVGMGASLGAVAMLHAHRNLPGAFAGLFLQSGSFFRERFDAHESEFPRFGRISRFVSRVLAARTWPDRVPVSLTCGTAEENRRNNHAMRDALVWQGYDVRFMEVRDAHTWTGWRDALDPALVDLLARALA